MKKLLIILLFISFKTFSQGVTLASVGDSISKVISFPSNTIYQISFDATEGTTSTIPTATMYVDGFQKGNVINIIYRTLTTYSHTLYLTAGTHRITVKLSGSGNTVTASNITTEDQSSFATLFKNTMWNTFQKSFGVNLTTNDIHESAGRPPGL